VNWQIRQFSSPQDLQPVLNLWASSGPGVQLSTSDEPAELMKKLTRDPDLFLVAVDGARIIGTVLGGFDGRRGLVYHLAVDPERRRQGIGKALMTELEGRLRAKGCLKYYLLVTPDNRGAIEFYQGLGWELMPLRAMGKRIE
jgi:ribosomal protein S18 acetylase RimI-like enzyme